MLEQKKKIKAYFSPVDKEKLNLWEKKYISSLYNWKQKWSSKQQEILEKIVIKYNLTEKEISQKIKYLPYDEKIEKFHTPKISSRNYRKIKKIKKYKKLN